MAADQSGPLKLKRTVGLFGIIALGVTSTVGAGILSVPGRVFAAAGSLTLPFVVISAVVVLLVALCLAELSSRFSETGGPYVYVDRAFGPIAGFAIAWLAWLSVVLAAASLLSLIAEYIGRFIPAANAPAAKAAIVLLTDAVVAVIVLKGIGEAAWISTFITIVKVAMLAGIALAGLFIAPAVSVQPSPSYNREAGVLILLFAFFGFDRVTAIAGEVVDPRRTLPLALIGAVAVITCIYGLIFLACLRSVPHLSGDHDPLGTIMRQVWGSRMEAVFLGGAMIMVLGTLLSQFVAFGSGRAIRAD